MKNSALQPNDETAKSVDLLAAYFSQIIKADVVPKTQIKDPEYTDAFSKEALGSYPRSGSQLSLNTLNDICLMSACCGDPLNNVLLATKPAIASSDAKCIFIRPLVGPIFSLDYNPSLCIEELKLSIQQKIGVQPDQQCLMYGEQILQDGHHLSNYDVRLNGRIEIEDVIKGAVSPKEKQILFKTYNRKTFTILVTLKHAIAQLKSLIQVKTDIASNELIFEQNRWRVSDDQLKLLIETGRDICWRQYPYFKMDDRSNKSDVCIYVVHTMEPNQVFIKMNMTGKIITPSLVGGTLIQEVKEKIHLMEGKPVDEQWLACNGKQLEGGRTFFDYNIWMGAMIHLTKRLCGGEARFYEMKDDLLDARYNRDFTDMKDDGKYLSEEMKYIHNHLDRKDMQLK